MRPSTGSVRRVAWPHRRADGMCIAKSTLDKSQRARRAADRLAEAALWGRKARPETTIHGPIEKKRAGRVIAPSEPQGEFRYRGVDSPQSRGIRNGCSRDQRFIGRARAPRRRDRRALRAPRRRDRTPARSDPRVRYPRGLEHRIPLVRRLAQLAGRPRAGRSAGAGPRGAGARHAAAACRGARARRALVRQGPGPHARGDAGDRGEAAGHRPRRHGGARRAHRPRLATHGSQSRGRRGRAGSTRAGAPRVSE